MLNDWVPTGLLPEGTDWLPSLMQIFMKYILLEREIHYSVTS